MSMAKRRTVYLRPKKDDDIIQFIIPLLERSDFSTVIRDLVRDGIKFRTQGVATPVVTSTPQQVTQSNTAPMPKLKLEKVKLSKEELEKRLDDF
jgi:hypothetical protein